MILDVRVVVITGKSGFWGGRGWQYSSFFDLGGAWLPRCAHLWKIHPSQHFLFIYFFVYLFTLKGKLIKIIPIEIIIIKKDDNPGEIPASYGLFSTFNNSYDFQCIWLSGGKTSVIKKLRKHSLKKLTNEENLVIRLYQCNCPQGPIS